MVHAFDTDAKSAKDRIRSYASQKAAGPSTAATGQVADARRVPAPVVAAGYDGGHAEADESGDEELIQSGDEEAASEGSQESAAPAAAGRGRGKGKGKGKGKGGTVVLLEVLRRRQRAPHEFPRGVLEQVALRWPVRVCAVRPRGAVRPIRRRTERYKRLHSYNALVFGWSIARLRR